MSFRRLTLPWLSCNHPDLSAYCLQVKVYSLVSKINQGIVIEGVFPSWPDYTEKGKSYRKWRMCVVKDNICSAILRSDLRSSPTLGFFKGLTYAGAIFPLQMLFAFAVLKTESRAFLMLGKLSLSLALSSWPTTLVFQWIRKMKTHCLCNPRSHQNQAVPMKLIWLQCLAGPRMLFVVI